MTLFDEPATKRCTKCSETKPISDFYAMKGMRDGFRNDCKACNLAAKKARYDADPRPDIERMQRWVEANRDRWNETQRRRRARPEVKARERGAYLLRKYGITLEEYDVLFERQGGVCAICGALPTEGISLHVDHVHETGKIRGLLCFRCNNALGDFGDDAQVLRQAIRYLDSFDADELDDLVRRRVRALVAVAG